MEYRVNKVTGLKELVMEGKLISIGSTVKEFNNDNKTQYRTGVVQLELVNSKTGEIMSRNAFCNIYEKSVSKLEVGKNYQTIITQMADGSKLCTLNSGVHVEALTDEFFEFGKVEVDAEVKEAVVLEKMKG